MLKLSKTGISILKKQYQSVLFKCFLIATGLFVAMSPNFANAVNLTITSGKNVNPTSGVHEGNGYNYDTINVSGGTLILDPSKSNPDAAHIRVTTNNGTSSISGGTINMEGENAKIKTASGVNSHTMNISGGKINMAKSSEFILTNMNVSNSAEINLSGVEFGADNLLTISGGTINTIKSNIFGGGGINMTGGTISINGSDMIGMPAGSDVTESFEPVSFTMSGGEIIVSGGKNFVEPATGKYYDVNDANVIFSKDTDNVNGDMTVSGGSITINNGGYLWLSSGFTVDGYTQIGNDKEPNIDSVEKGTINLTGEGTINLSGELTANVNGNGTISFNTTGGVLNGNVSNSNLVFKQTTNLGTAITGTIGNLNSISIASNKTLTINKTIGNVNNVNVNGALNVGTATLSATSITFNSGSVLSLHIASLENYGKITANSLNIAVDDDTSDNIDNGVKLNVTLESGLVAKDQTKTIEGVVVVSGEKTGEFEKISEERGYTENSRYKVFWSATTGALEITGTATPTDIVKDSGGTENNTKTAEAWDNINSTSDVSEKVKEVASIINTLSQNAVDDAGKKAYTDALTALAPDSAPSISKTSSETANQIFSAVGTRLSGGSISSTTKQGTSAGDAFENVAIWAQGLFNKAKLDKNSTGFDSKSYGIALGIEKNITDEVKVGLGYAYSTSDIDGYLRSTDVDTNSIIAYADYNRNNWYINGILSFGFSGYEENKNVAGTSVKGKWDVNSLGAQLMTGYNIKISDYGITPEIGFRYVHIDQDSYTDTADQKIKSHKGNIFTGVVGSKFNKEFNFNNDSNLIPEVRLALTYDFKQDDGDSIITLANGSSYSVDGEPLDKFGVELGLGVTSNITDTMELTIGYEGKFVKDYTDHTGLINFKYKF